MLKTRFWAGPLMAALVFWACGTGQEECDITPDTREVNISLPFQHFEDSLASFADKNELVRFFTRHPVIRDYVFGRPEYPNDSVFINEVHAKMSNPYIDTLLFETKKIFGDHEDLKRQFYDAFRNLAYYYPGSPLPRIQTVISGMDTDLFVSDTLIIVGLDFYLGRNARFRPNMYEYILRKYEPEDIVPSVMLLRGIDARINKSDVKDKTVLADMVAYGKSFYFAKRMLPCTPDSVLISYTPAEITGSKNNQDLIWARFVESEVLYSTSHIVKKDYLGERPFTVQVGEKCPGRIGQWVGWQIVNSYMANHKNVSLQQLMEMQDAQQLFRESRYRPDRR
jgi:hypothetical protein